MPKPRKERILLVHFLFNLGFTLAGWLLVVITFIHKPGFLSDNMRTVFTVIIGVVALVYLICELISYLLRLKALRTRNIHTQKSQDEVNGYLYDCLNNHDRTVVFTRGLSWATSSDRMRELLSRKAKDGELTVCVAEELPFTTELRELGAEIYAYHISEALLSSRFIILGYGTTHPVVNAGSKSGKVFINEVYDSKHAPNACKGFVELFERTKAQCMAHGAATVSDFAPASDPATPPETAAIAAGSGTQTADACASAE